ncbi:cytochrome c biogenesis protein CcsA [Shewanella sedimentimangrovi]|uniref:Cytochrome c biogenesis protein CcsA n=1 Tax=Shewanella sedimentimangrovi TaxID=2814293 RepID=A0ABX7R4K2_9GAMM|nr:cytochrome c biogenesis protein CcsA [Shewanella sedimentimangrovi]QSX37716.1 cytochrome c biogenesis protein CcsA [Shewanella sedimentimangrovi]
MDQQLELLLLWSGLGLYALAGSWGLAVLLLFRRISALLFPTMIAGFLFHTAAITVRWVEFGYGPFVTIFEILSSNIWSFVLIWLLCFYRFTRVRQALLMACPVFFMMMGWLLLTNPGKTFFPSTYYTVWLYIHVGFGKVFLGAVLMAVSLSLTVLLRLLARGRWAFQALPADEALSELAFRFLAVGLVFDTLMLISGAIWAQDAWGRYWSWDSLEVWALISWICMALTLHARFALELTPRKSALLVIAVFSVAFLTFFGIPFISQSAHKGII